MQITTKGGGWRCDYTLDDQSGDVVMIACTPAAYLDPSSGQRVEPEPAGYTREVVGWQAEAGEECQVPPDEWI